MSEGDVQVLKNELEHIKGQIADLKAEVRCLQQKLAGRLPLWATFLISLLFSSVSYLLTR